MIAMDHESQNMYSHKIKTAAEIAQLIGDRPRSKKVIMCHGTFDVVHPGHVRHLLYAKTKAPILIASLTADGLEGACSLGIGNFSLIIILSL